MTRSDRLLLSALLTASLAGPLVGLPVASQAGDPEPAPAALNRPEPEAPQVEHAEYWRARADEARARVAAARAALDDANATVSRMRRDNHPRGEARLQIREEQARAREAYEKALHHLDVELPAEARAAGAPRHWLRERR